jgi:uncharacterized protein
MKALSQAAPMSLQELDEFLTSDGAPDRSMALSNLDGFLTAVAIGPDRIKPSEWLPRIWGDETPEFLSEEEANRVIGTILGRYNQIITQLRDDPDRYQPLIRQNEHGQVIARDWVAGFMDGVALRFHGWQALLKSKEYRNDFAPIAVHLTDAQGNSPLNPEEENVKALIEQAAELIPAAVRSIDRFFKQTRPFFEGGTKVGRNDPCFCGSGKKFSGKKFKKCCGRP